MQRMNQPPSLALVFSLSLCVACSVDLGDVFGRDNAHGGGAQGGAGLGGAAAGASDTGAGSQGGAGNTTTTSTTSTTTTSTTSTTSTGMPEPTTVDCGGTPCPVDQGGFCCWDPDLQIANCFGDGQACEGGFQPSVAISCQDATDCDPGKVCCAHRQYDSTQAPYIDTKCESSCQDPDRVLCNPAAPNCPILDGPNGPVQSVCVDSQLLPDGYFVCTFP